MQSVSPQIANRLSIVLFVFLKTWPTFSKSSHLPGDPYDQWSWLKLMLAAEKRQSLKAADNTHFTRRGANPVTVGGRAAGKTGSARPKGARDSSVGMCESEQDHDTGVSHGIRNLSSHRGDIKVWDVEWEGGPKKGKEKIEKDESKPKSTLVILKEIKF